jgi:hypothetical protein
MHGRDEPPEVACASASCLYHVGQGYEMDPAGGQPVTIIPWHSVFNDFLVLVSRNRC